MTDRTIFQDGGIDDAPHSPAGTEDVTGIQPQDEMGCQTDTGEQRPDSAKNRDSTSKQPDRSSEHPDSTSEHPDRSSEHKNENDRSSTQNPGSLRQQRDPLVSRTAKQDDEKAGGLRISSLNYIFIIFSLVLTLILLWITIVLSGVYSSFADTTDKYNRIQNDALLVQSASDDLTENVRLFVMTGERRYMNEYFREANETKRREQAIDDLRTMEDMGDIIHLLENAVAESKLLMELEYEAMHYASLGYGYDESELPDEVRNYKLPDSAASMTAEEMIKESQDLVFGIDYRSSKARISGFREDFLAHAIEHMNAERDAGMAEMDRMLVLQRLGIIGITIMCLVLFVAISNMIVHPLRNAVGSIAAGKRINPIRGTYEIKYMSMTYNETYEVNKDVQDRLHKEAERDELTGIMNRRGYHLVVDKLAESDRPVAVLVMDIDRFKSINDTYGHITGDRMLKKVASLLIETFRSSDYAARIGGDEFVVIMTDITVKNRGTIRDKIHVINDTLLHPEFEEDPVMSLSVGCAFSPSGYNSHLFSQADAKMYDVKGEGGASIQFV